MVRGQALVTQFMQEDLPGMEEAKHTPPSPTDEGPPALPPLVEGFTAAENKLAANLGVGVGVHGRQERSSCGGINS